MFLIFQMELGTGLLNLTPLQHITCWLLKTRKKTITFLSKILKRIYQRKLRTVGGKQNPIKRINTRQTEPTSRVQEGKLNDITAA